MKTFKTESQATLEAKINCISALEKSHDIYISTEITNSLVANESIWLINHANCQCDCGQTSGVDVILFEEKIIGDISEELEAGQWELIKGDTQHNDIQAYCDMCGEED